MSLNDENIKAITHKPDYIADAAFQGLAYYTMSSMTNDPYKLARMAGYYKGVQSAGGAISYAMDAVKVSFPHHGCRIAADQQTPYLTEHLVSWGLLLLSLPLCFWVLWFTKDTNYDSEATLHVEDLKADEMDGVAIPTGHHLNEHDQAYDPNSQTEKKDDVYGGVRTV